MFGCKHEWEMVEKTILPSAFEQVVAKFDNRMEELPDMPLQVFEKKVIIILQCVKCGRLNKTIETNP